MLHRDLGCRPTKGPLTAQPFIDDDAQRVLVARRACFPTQLLRCHVRDRSPRLFGVNRARTMGRGSDAEVTEPDLVAGSEHDALWLDIAMDHSLMVGMLQCRGSRTDTGDAALQGQARAFGGALTR